MILRLWHKLIDFLSRFRLFRFVLKYEELLRYAVVGLLTTAVNFAVYLLLSRLFFRGFFLSRPELSNIVFNWIAWSAAVLFAFVANRCFVFEHHAKGGALLLSFLSFVALRLGSGVVENFTPAFFISLLSMNDIVAKLIVSVAVIILNYFFTKFISFAKRKPTAEE